MLKTPGGVLFLVLFATGIVRTFSLVRAYRRSPNKIVGLSRAAQPDDRSVMMQCGQSQGLMYRGFPFGTLTVSPGSISMSWPNTRHETLAPRGFGEGITLLLPSGELVLVSRTLLRFFQLRLRHERGDIIVWVSPRSGRRLIETLDLQTAPPPTT